MKTLWGQQEVRSQESGVRSLLAVFCLLSSVFCLPAQPAFPTNVVVSPRAAAAPLLTWTANAETNVVKYTVFIGVAPGTYNTNADVGTNRFALTGLGTGTFYAVVTASNALGLESDPSEEIRFTLPLVRARPARPVTLQTAELRVYLERADHLDGPWSEATNFPPLVFLASQPAGFYRPGRVTIALGPTLLTP